MVTTITMWLRVVNDRGHDCRLETINKQRCPILKSDVLLSHKSPPTTSLQRLIMTVPQDMT